MSFNCLKLQFCAVLVLLQLHLIHGVSQAIELSAGGTMLKESSGPGQLGLSLGQGSLLAEFSIDLMQSKDLYDLSAVDGFILDYGLSISQVGAKILTCNASRSICPTGNQNANGTACINPDKDSGNTTYARAVQAWCPDAYSWSRDDSKTHSIATGGTFTVTFCPTSAMNGTTRSQRTSTSFYFVNNCEKSISILMTASTRSGTLVDPIPSVSPAPSPSFAVSPAPYFHSSSGRKKIKLVPLIGAVSGATLVLVGCILVMISVRNRNIKTRKEAAHMQLLRGVQPALLPQQFKYKDLDIATGHFDRNLQLGAGGFGSVFKATLSDGTVVAVKRMIGANHHGYGQFKAEVMSIGTIHHVNLVKLRGFCIHGEECLLVYEYMPNGSLDKWLFNRDKHLNWSTRLSIALDIARALAYLHQGCSETILHLDIKPQNILLDERFRAKISDFGLSKLIDKEKSHIWTLHMRGTPGYMAPEWLHSRVTDKTDVFSFGIVILQIVSSKSTLEISTRTGSEIKLLTEVALELFRGGSLYELVDDSLVEESLEVAEVEKLVRIGLWCIQEEPSMRPSMDTVVKMLEDVIEVLDPPGSLTVQTSV